MQIIKDLLKDSKAKHWTDGLQWLGWSVIGGLMPIFVLLFALKATRQPIGVQCFTNNGEFALYSASYLGTAFYIVMRDFRRRAFPSRSVLALILVPGLLIAGCMYSFIALVNILRDSASQTQLLSLFNREFLRVVSLFLLPFVCALTYVIIVADNVHATADISAIARENEEALAKDFDKLEEA